MFAPSDMADADTSKRITGKRRAPPGEAPDGGSVSKMIGLMRYRSSPGFKGNKEDAADASNALATYRGLSSPDDRRRFLKLFEEQKASGKASLKFATTFSASIQTASSSSSTTNENYLTRPPPQQTGSQYSNISSFTIDTSAFAKCVFF